PELDEHSVFRATTDVIAEPKLDHPNSRLIGSYQACTRSVEHLATIAGLQL
ncbi:hypothetical protein FRC09_014280, partial [Ceratobasidium sp. 395]